MARNSANQGVYYQSPALVPGQGRWTTGLCQCSSDCSSCKLFDVLVPLHHLWADQGDCQQGSIMYVNYLRCPIACCGHGCLYLVMSAIGFQWLCSCINRSELKMQYAMQPSTCADCCVHFWCESCALCQEYRELKNRGFDMSLGWDGNVAKQNVGNGMVAPPLMPSRMTR
ncbi:hypothetical protein V2J09_018123 [Rumex salicifolius]